MKSQVWIVFAAALTTLIACKREQPAQPPQQGPYGAQQPPPYGQQHQQQPYGQPTQPAPYGQQQPPVQTTPVGQPPSPLSPPCQQLEGTCGFARCNLQAGRCAFPCNGNQDCIQGSSCLGAGMPIAACGPAFPGMAPPPQQ